MKRILTLLSALLLFSPPSPAADLGQLWNEAIAADTNQAPNERVRLFSQWIELAAAQGIKSPEAHGHLALAYWEVGDTGKAVLHQIESAKLHDSPFAAWKTLSKVHQIESEQAVREGVSTSPSLYLYFFLTPALVYSFGFFSLWSLVVAGFLYWYRGKKMMRLTASLISFALFCAIVPVGYSVIKRFLVKPIAVIDVAQGKPLGVYQNAEAKEENKIISLPSGILVRPQEVQGNFTRISQPLAGWVDTGSLKIISLTR